MRCWAAQNRIQTHCLNPHLLCPSRNFDCPNSRVSQRHLPTYPSPFTETERSPAQTFVAKLHPQDQSLSQVLVHNVHISGPTIRLWRMACVCDRPLIHATTRPSSTVFQSPRGGKEKKGLWSTLYWAMVHVTHVGLKADDIYVNQRFGTTASKLVRKQKQVVTIVRWFLVLGSSLFPSTFRPLFAYLNDETTRSLLHPYACNSPCLYGGVLGIIVWRNIWCHCAEWYWTSVRSTFDIDI